MSDSTGIGLFVYKRPHHTEEVLLGLRENNPGHLFIFADGPADSSEETGVSEVRKIISSIDFCEYTLIEHDTNQGLSSSVTAGADRMFAEHERIICIEDDCVPAPGFLDFMERCFDTYKDHDTVMNVTGYGMPIELPADYTHDIYFTHRANSWGWGTWKSRWAHFKKNHITVDTVHTYKNVLDKGGKDLFPMLKNSITGKVDSWAIWWALAVIENNGLCINPVRTLIRNVGFDGSGTHHGDTGRFKTQSASLKPVDAYSLPESPEIHTEINRMYNEYIPEKWNEKLKRRIRKVFGLHKKE